MPHDSFFRVLSDDILVARYEICSRIRIVSVRDFESREDAYYVGRPSPLGNPYRPTETSLVDALSEYQTLLSDKLADPRTVQSRAIQSLVEKLDTAGVLFLSCWCVHEPAFCFEVHTRLDDMRCHAELVRLAIADAVLTETHSSPRPAIDNSRCAR